MHTTDSSIKLPGGKIAELKINFKGMTMPVNVYLTAPKNEEPFLICVCYENTPIETRLYLDKTIHGWKERYSDDHELGAIIGPQVEKIVNQRIYN